MRLSRGFLCLDNRITNMIKVIQGENMIQTTVTVGPKTQVVIPKNVRKIAENIRAGKKVIVRPLSKSSVIIELVTGKWTKETYGMQKNVWKGIDASEYIDTLRKEWASSRFQ